MSLIHLEILEPEIDRLMDASEQTTGPEEMAHYFAEMGVCADCLTVLAVNWAEESLIDMIQENPDPPDEERWQLLTTLITAGFMRGYSLGHSLARND